MHNTIYLKLLARSDDILLVTCILPGNDNMAAANCDTSFKPAYFVQYEGRLAKTRGWSTCETQHVFSCKRRCLIQAVVPWASRPCVGMPQMKCGLQLR